MRVPRRLASVAVAGLTAVAMSGCGADPQASGSDFAAVIKGLDNPFFQQMEQGLASAARKSDVAVEIQAAQSITDTAGQADKLDALAQQGYDCHVVNPITGTNLIQGLARVAAEGTPVVNIDSPVEPAAARKAGLKLSTYIGTDNVQAGRMAGEVMTKAIGAGAVALVGGISGDVTSGARLEGFEQAVQGSLTVTQTVAADWDRQVALTKATDILAASPNVEGFFVANDDMALGVARAVANSGRAGEVTIISVDGIRDGLHAVKAGTIHATVAQYPYAMGQMGLQACAEAAAGKDLPTEVTAPIAVVTADNVDEALKAYPAPFQDYKNPFQ